MSRVFTLTISSNLEEAFTRIKDGILSEGGSFTGSLTSGTFQGKTELGDVEGKYQVEGNRIEVRILRKPFLLPMSMIESTLKGYFAEVARCRS